MLPETSSWLLIALGYNIKSAAGWECSPVIKAIFTPLMAQLPPCLTIMLASNVCVDTATGLCCVFLLESPGRLLLEREQELNVDSSNSSFYSSF